MTMIDSVEGFYNLDYETQLKVRKYLNKSHLAYWIQTHTPKLNFYGTVAIVYRKEYPDQENITNKGISEGIQSLNFSERIPQGETVIISIVKIDVSPELYFSSVPQNKSTIWTNLLE